MDPNEGMTSPCAAGRRVIMACGIGCIVTAEAKPYNANGNAGEASRSLGFA